MSFANLIDVTVFAKVGLEDLNVSKVADSGPRLQQREMLAAIFLAQDSNSETLALDVASRPPWPWRGT